MPQVGINLNELVYYVKGRPWVNVANSIAEFFSGSSTVYSTNADGYPTGIVNPNDLSARLDLGEGYPNGTYNVDWVGPANAVTVDGGTNGPTSCTFTKATSVLIQLFRIKADITDLRIWHSSENINETFNPVFLDKMKDYAGVRCMNWASPNHDWTPDWNTRRTRTSWSQGRKSVGGGEVAWEFQCELANKIRKPLWLCIHWRASLSYARKLAALIHKELDPDIPVIFEHGNELWNAAFPQFAYSIAPGTGNMADTDQYRRGFVWHAKRTADIGAVFKSVMKGRQVTVALGAQAAGYGFWDYCRSGDPTGDLAAALPNIDAFAIAPYFGNYCMSTDGLRDAVLAGGVDVIFSQIRTHLDMTDNSGPYTQMTEWKNRANTEGKILLGYEGGQHVSLRGVDQGNATLIAHMASANRDSRMYNLYLEYLDQWKTRTGNSLMFLFNDVQDDGSHGAWGHERYEGEAQFRTGGAVGTNHKYKAVWDWINGTTLAGAPTDTMFRAVAALPAVPEPNTIYAIKATTDSDCQIVMTDRAGMPVPLNTGNVYVDVFETPGTGTWTKRAGAVMVKAIAIGGGNGGGSGRRGAAGSDRYGGGGGGGGGIAVAEFPASVLGATEFVWVGAGGAGGAAVTSNDTNGNPGITGYPSAFGCTDNTLSGSTATGTKLKTGAGVPAGGGTNAAGAAGTGGAGFPGLALIGNGSSGGAGSNGAGAAATASGLACPGGGGGGGINTSNTASAGGAGGGTGLASGSGPIAFYVGGAGGAVGVAGEDGANASTPVPGSGGGGGGASTSAAGGDGGAGGIYGAGGGGGGASANGFASGKGGDGANGCVVVVTSLASPLIPLLDVYTGAAAAYSIRKLRTAYSGAAIRVRRASDSAEQDIGFDINGDIDSAAMLAFCGIGDGFVTTWYDQSGNGRDFSKPTAGGQPQIVASGAVVQQGGKPAIDFLSSKNLTTLAVPFTASVVPFALFAVVSPGSGSVNRGVFANRTGADGMVLFSRTGSATAWGTWNGSGFEVSSAPINSRSLLEMLSANGQSGNYYLNASSGGSFAGTAGDVPYIGGAWGQQHDGTIQELIFYESDKSSDRAGIASKINSYYFIY